MREKTERGIFKPELHPWEGDKKEKGKSSLTGELEKKG